MSHLSALWSGWLAHGTGRVWGIRGSGEGGGEGREAEGETILYIGPCVLKGTTLT